MAAFIPEEKISEVRDVSDIVEIISETVVLKKAGRNYIGLCPFHSEKTPSFTVSPEKQIFYCFGCSIGGNVISFIMKRDGLSFPEAVKSLASRYGVILPAGKMTEKQKKLMTEKELIFETNSLAKSFFRNCLIKSEAGQKAFKYLIERGTKESIIEDFSIGYAPSGWSGLYDYLLQKKIDIKTIEKTGLIVPKREKKGYYDRFRDRIIFPIFDIHSKVIGFGGRVIDNSLPKYINSPETLVYSKGRSLYGIDKAKPSARNSETVFIVEGYMDLAALHQNDIKNSVATLGTSLTGEHVKIIRGLVGKDGTAIMVYDSDAAGIKAAERSIEIFEGGFLKCRIMVLPSGEDPDSFLQKYKKEHFVKIAQESLGSVDFLINRSVEKYGLSIEGKLSIIDALKNPISSIRDKVAQSLYIKELSEKIGVAENQIIEKILKNKVKTDEPRIVKSAYVKKELIERKIVSMILQFKDVLPEIKKFNPLTKFKDTELKQIGETAIGCLEAGASASDVLLILEDEKARQTAAELLIEEESWDIAGCVKLIANFIEQKENKGLKILEQQIKEAEKDGDNELLLKLLEEKQKTAVLKQQRKMALFK